jgi:hypothetical protein
VKPVLFLSVLVQKTESMSAFCRHHCNENLLLHFSENGYAKYDGDVKGMENTVITIDPFILKCNIWTPE